MTLPDTAAAEASAAAPAAVADEVHEEHAHDEHIHAEHAEEIAAYAEDAARAEHAGEEHSSSSHDEHAAQPPQGDEHHDDDEDDGDDAEEEVVESVGGDDVMEEVPERAFRPRRQYKIQEVIKRRQVMLVQVVKEERGNKGAALTTYLSLAGRYAVLMPNTARGGGISRKITSAQDRSRLKEVVQDLDVPEGMGIILRTAGASRTKPEIKRDFEYLIRMWETVRDMTLKSQAPTLVYEEGSLIKRSLRDLYNKEIDEIQVAGEAGYQEARDFMKMLMPSNVRAVRQYRDGQPLFSRMGVESQLDAMFSPTVQLRSGGYIVINQTEALVSIDVNSGRSTREHHIEDTALKTNLEAAEEVARQLRLRDLAGLIVIDFIDMDEKRNNRSVERKLSDCLRQDRARIQVGRISHFGLLEMSRQRIRASVLESSTEPCPQCGGSGHVRSVSSVALQLLRGLEEILMK
ncbi:MAG TPA: Rne/Rng family ribonuclease, partial [Pseudolabrys sp.]